MAPKFKSKFQSEIESKLRPYIKEKGKASKELKDNICRAFCWGIVLAPDFLPLLGRLLSENDPELVRYAIQLIWRREKKGIPFVPKLVEIANTPKKGWEGTPSCAVNAIWKITGNPELVMPYLLDEVTIFPEEGCDLVYEVGQAPKEVVPALIRIIKRGDYDETWAAVDALGALGPAARSAKAHLLKLKQHESEIIAAAAIRALKRIDRKNKPQC